VSLDAQAGDRPADDELLDLARAFEDRVAHAHRFCGCRPVLSRPLTRRFAIRVSDGWCSVRSVLGMARENGPPPVAGLNCSEHGTTANTSGKVRRRSGAEACGGSGTGSGIIGCRYRALGEVAGGGRVVSGSCRDVAVLRLRPRRGADQRFRSRGRGWPVDSGRVSGHSLGRS
jgi:hypothetical protein